MKGSGGKPTSSSAFTGKCKYYQKEGHKSSECRKKVADKGKVDKPADGAVRMIVGDSSSDDDRHDDGDEGWCMGVQDSFGVNSIETDVVILDGGSDAHVAPSAFGEQLPLEPSTSRLRDVQAARITLEGARKIPMVLAGTIAATTKFDISPSVTRPLWSVGKLYDSDFGLVISKRFGTYLGKKKADGSYERVDLTRVKNCFGVAVTVHGTSKEAA